MGAKIQTSFMAAPAATHLRAAAEVTATPFTAGAGMTNLEGGGGNDWLDGGEDSDRLSFPGVPSPVQVDCENGQASGQGLDTFFSIEHFEDASVGRVVYTGNSRSP